MVGVAASVFLLAFASVGQADTILCTAEPCIATIPGAAPDIFVASDGEAPFDPFGIGVFVSDAIQFTAAGAWSWDAAFGAPTWTFVSIGGTDVWYITESAVEPIGHWIHTGGWSPEPGVLLMLETPAGPISDRIVAINNASGIATISFESDVDAVPEPSTLSMLGVGLVYVTRRLRRKAA